MLKEDALYVARAAAVYGAVEGMLPMLQARGLVDPDCEETTVYVDDTWSGIDLRYRRPGSVSATVNRACVALGMPASLRGVMRSTISHFFDNGVMQTETPVQQEVAGLAVWRGRINYLAGYYQVHEGFGHRRETTRVKLVLAKLDGAHIVENSNPRYKSPGHRVVCIAKSHQRLKRQCYQAAGQRRTSILWACYPEVVG